MRVEEGVGVAFEREREQGKHKSRGREKRETTNLDGDAAGDIKTVQERLLLAIVVLLLLRRIHFKQEQYRNLTGMPPVMAA